MFHSFFNSLARSRYLSFFSLSFRFILWSAGTAKSTILKILFFLLIIIRSGLLAEIRWSVCMLKSHRSLCVSLFYYYYYYYYYYYFFNFISFIIIFHHHQKALWKFRWESVKNNLFYLFCFINFCTTRKSKIKWCLPRIWVWISYDFIKE